MYENGEGVEVDGAEALYWYIVAGNQGSYEGCMAAAEIYEKGELGVPLDNAFAYAWYSVALKHAESDEEKQLADDACYRALAKTTPDQMAGLAKASEKRTL
jgi:TPR repeat protein